jgi:hypothetical protein
MLIAKVYLTASSCCQECGATLMMRFDPIDVGFDIGEHPQTSPPCIWNGKKFRIKRLTTTAEVQNG